MLLAIAIGLQFIKSSGSNIQETMRVVPEDAALVLETENIVSLLENINENNQFKEEFADIEYVGDRNNFV